jgi:hypothetical protein
VRSASQGVKNGDTEGGSERGFEQESNHQIEVVRLSQSLNLEPDGQFSLSPEAGKSSIGSLSALLPQE